MDLNKFHFFFLLLWFFFLNNEVWKGNNLEKPPKKQKKKNGRFVFSEINKKYNSKYLNSSMIFVLTPISCHFVDVSHKNGVWEILEGAKSFFFFFFFHLKKKKKSIW